MKTIQELVEFLTLKQLEDQVFVKLSIQNK